MKILIQIIMSLTLLGCSAESVEVGTTSSEVVQPDSGTEKVSVLQSDNFGRALGLPGEFTDPSGKHWTCLNKAKVKVADKTPEIVYPKDAIIPETVNLPTDAKELAESLRTVTVIGGYECIGDANIELAEKILSGLVDGELETPGSGGDELPAQEKACCGTDGRINGVYSSFVDKIGFSEIGCTIAFIHPDVAVTAAHCMYETVNNFWWVVNRTSTTTDYPYFRRAVNGNTQPYATLDCFNFNVPSAWVNLSAQSASHDYAFIDFTGGGYCDTTGVSSNAWFGTRVATNTEIAVNTTYNAGYPKWVNLSGGHINGPGLTNQWVFLNSTWGNQTWINAVPYYQYDDDNTPYTTWILHLKDASGGDSGRPHLFWNGTGFSVIGIHHGTAPGDGYNLDNRWTTTVRNWVQANTPF